MEWGKILQPRRRWCAERMAATAAGCGDGLDIAKLSDTYHAWREGKGYEDISGFCKSASLEEIRAHGHVLTPGRYVGAEDVEDDDESFEEKMPRLAAALRERFAKRAVLEKKVNQNLEGMGYGG